MLLPNAQDASAKTYSYSHCAPQFCCGVPSPSRPRLPSRPVPSSPSCSPQLGVTSKFKHTFFS